MEGLREKLHWRAWLRCRYRYGERTHCWLLRQLTSPGRVEILQEVSSKEASLFTPYIFTVVNKLDDVQGCETYVDYTFYAQGTLALGQWIV